MEEKNEEYYQNICISQNSPNIESIKSPPVTGQKAWGWIGSCRYAYPDSESVL